MTAQSTSSMQAFEPLGPGDPAEVDGYRLRARLGSGGMGSVYLSHTRGGQPVALKVVRPELAGNPEFRRRFEQEVRAARRVQGPYTAPVLDSDTEGDMPWLATAYVPGPPLGEAVTRHGPLPESAVVLLVAGIAEALQGIHGAGVIHRDLKPSNVVLAADGPRVIDFGIARAADDPSLTGSSVRVGTPAYMAPEHVNGASPTPAADVFALGLIAHYAATGISPFGDGNTPVLLYRIVSEEPDLSACPDRLRPLVARCLAKDPTRRPTPAQVIAACQELVGDDGLRRDEGWLPVPVVAEITTRIERQPSATTKPYEAPVPAPASDSVPGASAAPKRGRRKRIALLAALVVLSVVAGGGAAAWSLRNAGDGDDREVAGNSEASDGNAGDTASREKPKESKGASGEPSSGSPSAPETSAEADTEAGDGTDPKSEADPESRSGPDSDAETAPTQPSADEVSYPGTEIARSCRDWATMQNGGVSFRPCVERTADGLLISADVKALTAEGVPAGTSVWIWPMYRDKEAMNAGNFDRTREDGTWRKCRLTLSDGTRVATCGPFKVTPERAGSYSTAGVARLTDGEEPPGWDDPTYAGTQSPAVSWPPE
ncbi:protein kinase [Streptomyces collinus]|uniref:serine/threonine-protein kinase n=1 Tax=Streptomyces collinus TaxID=42684 RepID=UPI00378924BD